MKWVNVDQAAKLLGVHPDTLRRRESWDGKWCTIHGHQIRVYRQGIHPQPHRRYNEAEIRRVLAAVEAARQRKESRAPWWV